MSAPRSQHPGSADEPSRFDPKNRITHLDFVEVQSSDTEADISSALLRLLTRLANCGLTAGAPPVLYEREESL
jgi:hypothetical protein